MSAGNTNNEHGSAPEISTLLGSLPRAQAPSDLEPQVMRRVAVVRRRRGLFMTIQATVVGALLVGALIDAASNARDVAAPRRPAIDSMDRTRVPRRVSAAQDNARVTGKCDETDIGYTTETLAIETTTKSRRDIELSGRDRAHAPINRQPSAHAAPESRVASEGPAVAIDTITAARVRSPKPAAAISPIETDRIGSTATSQTSSEPTGSGNVTR